MTRLWAHIVFHGLPYALPASFSVSWWCFHVHNKRRRCALDSHPGTLHCYSSEDSYGFGLCA